MEQDIISNHAGISATAVNFLDYAIKEGKCLNRLDLLDEDVPPLLRDYKYPLQSWPWFISPATKRVLEECVQLIPSLIVRSVMLEFGEDTARFADYYGTPDVVGQLVLSGTLKTRFVSQRTDAILTEKGFKILELNLGFRIGGWQIQWIDPQYRKQAELKPFLDRLDCHSRDIPYGYMCYLIRSIQEKQLLSDGRANTIFVIEDDEFFAVNGPVTIGEIYDRALRDHGLGGWLKFKRDLSDLTYAENGVYLGGERVGAVVSAEDNPPLELFRACAAGRVVWTDNPVEVVLSDKRSLALLYKHRDHPAFSESERRVIHAFLPWGASLRAGPVEFEGQTIDLQSLLSSQKDRFVIKIALGGQGNDVFVGKYQTPQDWARLIERGLSEDGWLVQEFCRSLPFYGQQGDNGYGLYDVVWGVYGFGEVYSGCWLRLMARDTGNGVINSDKGAEEAIVYEVAC